MVDAVTHPPKKIVEPFVPTFEKPLWHGLNGSFGSLNEAYFATPETAAAVMQRYGGVAIIPVPFLADGGPFWTEPKQLFIRFRTPGRRECDVNAGWLADFFRAFPENEFPGLADRYARQMIDHKKEETDRNATD